MIDKRIETFYLSSVVYGFLGTGRIYDAGTQRCLAVLEGHDGEVSKVCFSPQGHRILSGSADKTARIWDSSSGRVNCFFKN